MNKTIADIIKAAVGGGACKLASEVDGIESLVALFFAPQGKEFCSGRNFPPLQSFRRLEAEFRLAQYGVYADAGDVSLSNKGNVALVGETRAELHYEGVERKYTVILMHGAKATIKARNHAVIEVINVRCEVEYDIDKTVVLL